MMDCVRREQMKLHGGCVLMLVFTVLKYNCLPPLNAAYSLALCYEGNIRIMSCFFSLLSS